jgi:hypothetical protein
VPGSSECSAKRTVISSNGCSSNCSHEPRSGSGYPALPPTHLVSRQSFGTSIKSRHGIRCSLLQQHHRSPCRKLFSSFALPCPTKHNFQGGVHPTPPASVSVPAPYHHFPSLNLHSTFSSPPSPLPLGFLFRSSTQARFSEPTPEWHTDVGASYPMVLVLQMTLRHALMLLKTYLLGPAFRLFARHWASTQVCRTLSKLNLTPRSLFVTVPPTT